MVGCPIHPARTNMIEAIHKEKHVRGELAEIDSAIEQIEHAPENKAIDPKDFIGVSFFTKDEVERDLKLVEEKERKIKSQKLSEQQIDIERTAHFVETVIPEAIKKLGWLGEKVKVIKPSRYDDLFRGIDNVVQILPEKEIENEKWIRCIGFSMDFTISRKEAQEKAFEEILAIAKGKVPSMKYFKTEIMTSKGEMEIKLKNFKLPKVIMSCPQEIMNESKEDLLNFETNPEDTEAKTIAENTPLRFYFIKEALAQLDFFADLANRFENKAAKEVYRDSRESFKEILEEQGIDEKVLAEKIGRFPGLIGKEFDLDANGGQFLEILKTMIQKPEK